MGEPIYRQSAHDAAEQRAERFRIAFGPFVVVAETARMAVVFTGRSNGRNPLIFVNDSFLALTGFARDDILGQDLSLLLGNEADRATLGSIEAALVAGVDGTWELRCRKANGCEFLAAVDLSPVRDENGVVRQSFLSFVELGGHIDRMLEQRNELHALYEQAPGFIATSDGPNHVFTFANASYKRLVGRTDLVGVRVAEAIPEIAAQGFIEHLDRVFQTGEPHLGTSVPIRLNAADGASAGPRYINFVYQPVRDASNSITGLFCEGYDVTAEHEAAEQLASLQAELIHLSRVNAMGAMATTLAHELNQPLTAISSYVAGCRYLVDPDAPNAARILEALRATEEASQRAGDIIRHVRDLTRRGAPAKASFGLKAAIDECVRLVRAGGCSGVDLRGLTIDDVTIVADRIQIQQVIINLLRNACDAVEEASDRRVTIVAEVKTGDVVVSVTDRGAGVSVEAAQTIFSWTDTKKEGGMGLGLSISRAILEAHRGHIWLDRSDRTGSTFCFSVPYAADPVSRAEEQRGG